MRGRTSKRPFNEQKNTKNTSIFPSCALFSRYTLIALDDLGDLPRTPPCHPRA